MKLFDDVGNFFKKAAKKTGTFLGDVFEFTTGAAAVSAGAIINIFGDNIVGDALEAIGEEQFAKVSGGVQIDIDEGGNPVMASDTAWDDYYDEQIVPIGDKIKETIDDISGKTEREEQEQEQKEYVTKMADKNIDQANIRAESIQEKAGQSALQYRIQARRQLDSFRSGLANTGVAASGSSGRRLDASMVNVEEDISTSLTDTASVTKAIRDQAIIDKDHALQTLEWNQEAQADAEKQARLNAGFSAIGLGINAAGFIIGLL